MEVRLSSEEISGQDQSALPRNGSLVGGLERVSRAAAHATGTEKGNEDLARIGITIGVLGLMIGATSALTHGDGAQINGAFWTVTGGAFAGDAWKPFSRWTSPTAHRLIRDLQDQQEITSDDLQPFFEKFDSVLRARAIRKYVVGHTSENEQRDPRYAVLAYLITRSQGELGIDVKSKKGRALLKEHVWQLVRHAQIQAQDRRNEPDIIRRDSVLRTLDLTSGVLLMGAFVFGLNQLLQGHINPAYSGLSDEIAIFTTTAASAFTRHGGQTTTQDVFVPGATHERWSPPQNDRVPTRRVEDRRSTIQQRQFLGRR